MREDVQLVPFEAAHLDDALALSRAIGWRHRREDWALVLSCGAGFVARAGGRIVGTAIATFNGAGHATICMVLVDAARRGAGLGRLLTGAALDLCGDREVRLIATAEGRRLYESFGFVPGHRVAQHQGEAILAPAPAGAAAATAAEFAGDLAGDLAAIVALDRAATGMDRAALFARLAARGGFVVARRGEGLAGFAGAREFGRGVVVGPAAADSPDIARALIGAQLAAHSGRVLRVDTPVGCGLSDWLGSIGLPRVGEGLAMRRPARAAGPAPAAPARFATYALAAQAFG